MSIEQDSRGELGWSSFVVDDSPHCMWAIGRRDQNLRFLRGIDPNFYKYLIEIHVTALEGTGRKNAALAIRLAYSQAMETFFALLGAAIQAPDCPLGWMLMYENRHLYSVVRKLAEGRPLYTRKISLPVTWETLSNDIHLFQLEDKTEERRIKRLFATTWAMLAQDFLSDSGSDEYNSIKHGLRVQAGGFSVVIGADEDGASPIIDSRSEFGTRFFFPVGFGGKWTNFYAQDAGRNWTPVALAVRIELIALSIGNVIAYLRAKLLDEVPTVKFLWPVESAALGLAWEVEHLVESMRGGDTIDPSEIKPLSKSDIMDGYDPISVPEKNE